MESLIEESQRSSSWGLPFRVISRTLVPRQMSYVPTRWACTCSWLKQDEREDKSLASGFFCEKIFLVDSLKNLPELDCDASRTAKQSIIPGRQGPAFKADMSAVFFRFLKPRKKYC